LRIANELETLRQRIASGPKTLMGPCHLAGPPLKLGLAGSKSRGPGFDWSLAKTPLRILGKRRKEMHDQQTVSSSQGREPEAMHSHDYKVEVRIRSRAASCFFVVMDVEEISEKGTAAPPLSCLSFPIIRSTWMAQVNHRMATFSTLDGVSQTPATPPSLWWWWVRTGGWSKEVQACLQQSGCRYPCCNTIRVTIHITVFIPDPKFQRHSGTNQHRGSRTGGWIQDP
jgi:hypothetical protein